MKASLQEWKEYLSQFPNAHILQSGEWGELKSRFGWQSERIISNGIGAQILYRRLPAGYHIGYIAKGPVGGEIGILQDEIDRLSRALHTIFLKLEPDGWLEVSPESSIAGISWQVSRPIQPQRTVVVSLDGSPEDILARMKQKTRYNIRLAEKKGVTVSSDSDLAAFYAMMKTTGARDRFGVHSMAYYQAAYDLFHPLGQCELFTARVENKPLAALMVFVRGETAWYMYRASTDQLRNLMPTYLLQWQAMLWAKARGCLMYDLWGIPDLDEEELEENFVQKESHQGLWGVYRFKRGFGGQVRRSLGAADRVYKPLLYRAYQQVLKARGGSEE
jgi:lipid II:glycine glycyltransferase (peptidoglycan interpeptide bridge formation enzyme)